MLLGAVQLKGYSTDVGPLTSMSKNSWSEVDLDNLSLRSRSEQAFTIVSNTSRNRRRSSWQTAIISANLIVGPFHATPLWQSATHTMVLLAFISTEWGMANRSNMHVEESSSRFKTRSMNSSSTTPSCWSRVPILRMRLSRSIGSSVDKNSPSVKNGSRRARWREFFLF